MMLKVIKDCLCPYCKEYQAERIKVFNWQGFMEYKGCLCKCGYREKAIINLKGKNIILKKLL